MMPFRFLRNPLAAARVYIRSTVGRVADSIRDPITRAVNPELLLGQVGRTLGIIGRTFARRGAALEAEALRRAAQREADIVGESGDIYGMPDDLVIDDDEIPEAVTRIRRRYAWTVRAQYIDPITGETVNRFLTISTDRRLSKSEVFAEAHNMLASEYEVSGDTVVSVDVDRVVRAGQQGTL